MGDAAPIVGIDLGTTHSLVAICDERGPRVLPVDDGSPLLPSVVRFMPEGEVVGREAREARAAFASITVAGSKRYMGRGFAESVAAGDSLDASLLAEGPRGLAAFRVGGRLVTPQEVAARILAALRDAAAMHLGRTPSRAVITVPAYFDDAQRQATRDAARLAGLEAVRIVNEPTAAALAYGLGMRRSGAAAGRGGGPAAGSAPDECVVVYDLGGGTFDVSVLRRSAAEEGELFEVLSTAGDTRLGGDDVDERVARLIAGGRVPADPGDRERLRRAAEDAKIRLSSVEQVDVEVPLGSGERLAASVTREAMEAACGDLLARTAACCRRAMSDAGNPRVDRVVLVGGSTRMPAVRRQAQELFGMEPYTALDPDQVVALGAAVQAAVVEGRRSDMLLLDVIPLSLGIETRGGAVAKLLMRNSPVPTRAVELFSTNVDNQTGVKIHVLQGEREMAADCRSIARMELRGIPPMPAGIPQVEVEFLVDQNGVLQVSARERRSGRRAAIQVVPSYGLTPEEVEAMDRDALLHAREDMTRHRVVDLVVNSSLDLKWIGDAMARVTSQLPPAYRQELEASMGTLREFIARAEENHRQVDPDAFHRAKESLDRLSVRLQELAIADSLRQE